jgi:hypothetical protein
VNAAIIPSVLGVFVYRGGNMITKETCAKILNCYREIENAQGLIKNMAETIRADKEKKPDLFNAFGERKGLELGVPFGNSAHRLYNVSIDLGVKIIEDHIKTNEAKLIELMAVAKLELV